MGGRLQSIKNPQEKDYYCFSAGCLGVVSLLTNCSANEMIDNAFKAQRLRKNGEISRFEVVDQFINDLIHNTSNVLFLERIHIITTRLDKGVTIRKATSMREMKEMLIQTTFIPFVTGF